MKTANEPLIWGTGQVSFWMTMPIALGIIFIGIRFLLEPTVAATGFGIPFSSPGDFAFGWAKGIRDIFSGLAILSLLLLKMRRATAWVFTSAIIIPVTDCLTILATNGPSDVTHLLIHGLTAVYMIITAFLLFRINKTQTI